MKIQLKILDKLSFDLFHDIPPAMVRFSDSRLSRDTDRRFNSTWFTRSNRFVKMLFAAHFIS